MTSEARPVARPLVARGAAARAGQASPEAAPRRVEARAAHLHARFDQWSNSFPVENDFSGTHFKTRAGKICANLFRLKFVPHFFKKG